jgi:hypothetical protein
MSKFKIAHLREQGQDMVIVPLESSFGSKSQSDQQAAISGLQLCARRAGLAGTVVPVWTDGNGFKFIAPRQWHDFFTSLSFDQIMASINKELTCG